MITYPKKLEKGDTIGITAPSSGVVEKNKIEKLENAYANFFMLGYDTMLETANVRNDNKFVSSDSKTRAKEFMELWENKEVKWIMPVTGGEFLMDMLPFIDKEAIKQSTPKWVQGFSDISLLNYYITTNFNIATVHARNFATYGIRKLDSTMLKTVGILEDANTSLQESAEFYQGAKIDEKDELEPYNLTERVEYKNLKNRQAEKISGRVIGGCIDVLRGLMGTELDNTVNFCEQFKEEGILWYLENCEMPVTDIYRTLWQMRESGWFKNSNGFLIGRTASQETMEDFEYVDALNNALGELNVPIIYDVDIGHVAPQWTMINGAYGEFEYLDGKGKITQKMI